MKRPYFTQCIVIDNGEQIWIKASVGVQYQHYELEDRLAYGPDVSTPFDRIGLLKKNHYGLKIEGRDGLHHKIFEKSVETDQFGNIQINIPSFNKQSRITHLQFFETSMVEGIELLMESIIPYKLKHPLKIIISDFDKTLVDTKYSTPREMYHSLSKPLSFFPTVNKSLNMLHHYIQQGFQPFILSASPHFYEKPIRDWLYQNNIFTSNIFLKDYRDVLSWTSGELSPKDIKKQGFYKLDALVDILECSTMPEEIILMGDGFESDITIYLALRSILVEKRDPWQVWNYLRKHKAFKLSTKQNFTFLQRLNKLSSLARKKASVKMAINIRCRQENFEKIKQTTLEPHFFEKQKQFVNFYIA